MSLLKFLFCDNYLNYKNLLQYSVANDIRWIPVGCGRWMLDRLAGLKWIVGAFLAGLYGSTSHPSDSSSSSGARRFQAEVPSDC